MLSGTSKACNPSAQGCYDTIKIMTSHEREMAHYAWDCIAPTVNFPKDESGHYFVISENSNVAYPNPGWCKIDVYKD